MTKEEAVAKKYKDMTEKPVSKLVMGLALPAIVAVVITSVYNMADSFYLGRVSTAATAAVGVVYAYMALIQALAFFFGHGSGNFISRALGAKQEQQAKRMASVGFFLSFFSGILIAGLSAIFMDPLLRLMGATDTSIAQARGYFTFILLATPFLMSSLTLNNQLRFQGNALFSMIGIGIGGVLNIGLDPLFIFACHMDAAGAGLATMISQMISFSLLLFLTYRKDNIPVRIKDFRPSGALLVQIVRGGLPSLGRQGLMAIAGVCLNQACAFSLAGEASTTIDSAIAAFSVVTRLLNMASSIAIGLGQGFQPVCGFNYGAKKYERVKKAFWFVVAVATGYSIAVSILGFLIPDKLVGLIRNEDPYLLEVGATALRCESYVFFLCGSNMICNMFLQTINKTMSATMTAIARSGLFYIPLLFLFGKLWGIQGLEWAQPVADVLAFALALPFGLYHLYHMDKEDTGIPEALKK